MKVDTMRAVDRWAGMPLCFLLTLLGPLLGLKRAPRAPRRILWIELSEMGSTILADPAMRKAKTLFDAELFFVIFKRNAGSLDFFKTIPAENIFTLREDSLWTLLIDTLRFLVWTRRRGIDTVIDLELFSRFTALLTGLSGAVNRVGYYRFHNEGLYRGELLTHRVAYNPHQHIAKNFIALVNALGAEIEQIPYSKSVISDDETRLLPVTPDPVALAKMRKTITAAAPGYDPAQHRLVLINPNASELLPQRRWPLTHFAALAEMILERWEDVIILVTGAPSELPDAQKLCSLVAHPRMINFAGRVKLGELVPLYQSSVLMVSNDSGPGHFASVTTMPTIVLFGPETPALYGSLGPGQALTAIQPTEVFDAVVGYLDGAAQA